MRVGFALVTVVAARGQTGSDRCSYVDECHVARILSWRVYDETKPMRDTSGGMFQKLFECFRRMIVACFAVAGVVLSNRTLIFCFSTEHRKEVCAWHHTRSRAVRGRALLITLS